MATSARAVQTRARMTRPRARCPDPRAHGLVRARAVQTRARMDTSARVGRWGRGTGKASAPPRAWSRVVLLCLLVRIFFGFQRLDIK